MDQKYCEIVRVDPIHSDRVEIKNYQFCKYPMMWAEILSDCECQRWLDDGYTAFRLGVPLVSEEKIFEGDRIIFLKKARLTPLEWRMKRMARAPRKKKKGFH